MKRAQIKIKLKIKQKDKNYEKKVQKKNKKMFEVWMTRESNDSKVNMRK